MKMFKSSSSNSEFYPHKSALKRLQVRDSDLKPSDAGDLDLNFFQNRLAVSPYETPRRVKGGVVRVLEALIQCP